MIQTPLGIIEIIKDGKVIAFTTSNSYTDSTETNTDGKNTDCSIRKMRNEPMLRIELTICNFG